MAWFRSRDRVFLNEVLDRYRREFGELHRPHGPAALPDFFCIGAEKAGTTWLHRMFQAHPEIGVPALKELRYFLPHKGLNDLRDFLPVRRLMDNPADLHDGSGRARLLEIRLQILLGDQDDYLSILGACSGQVVGDTSPQYYVLPPRIVRRMKKLAPEARIILMVRDPVARAVSGAKIMAKRLREPLTDQIIAKYAFKQRQLEMSRVSVAIERYEAIFGSPVFLGLFDRIAEEPLPLLQEVCTFLGVSFDPEYFPKADRRFNRGPEFEADITVRRKLYRTLKAEYDLLETRFPDQVRKWRAQYT